MTDSERNLLVWCGIMLVRDTPLTPAETAVIDQLIADVRSPMPEIEWIAPNVGKVRQVADYRDRSKDSEKGTKGITDLPDDWFEDYPVECCGTCGGSGVIESECECGDDTCCCLNPIPPICAECKGSGV